MKKLFAFVLGISMVLGVAANAAATLESGDFYSLVSDGTNEFMFDIDSMIDGVDANKVDSGLTLSSFTEAETWSDVTLFAGAYYGSGSMLENYDYLVALDETPTALRTTANLSFSSAISNSYYNVSAVDGYDDVYSTTVLTGTSLSNKQDSFTGVEAIDLSAFDEGVTEIIMNLYTISSSDWGATWTITELDNEFFVLSLNDDGTLSAEIRAVPVPAAVWLLGSGLLGLIGIRRRNA